MGLRVTLRRPYSLHGRAALGCHPERCEGFETLAQALADFNLQTAADTTGVPVETIAAAARLYAARKPAVVVGCGCGPILLIIFILLACGIFCNTNWLKLFVP